MDLYTHQHVPSPTSLSTFSTIQRDLYHRFPEPCGAASSCQPKAYVFHGAVILLAVCMNMKKRVYGYASLMLAAAAIACTIIRPAYPYRNVSVILVPDRSFTTLLIREGGKRLHIHRRMWQRYYTRPAKGGKRILRASCALQIQRASLSTTHPDIPSTAYTS